MARGKTAGGLCVWVIGTIPEPNNFIADWFVLARDHLTAGELLEARNVATVDDLEGVVQFAHMHAEGGELIRVYHWKPCNCDVAREDRLVRGDSPERVRALIEKHFSACPVGVRVDTASRVAADVAAFL